MRRERIFGADIAESAEKRRQKKWRISKQDTARIGWQNGSQFGVKFGAEIQVHTALSN